MNGLLGGADFRINGFVRQEDTSYWHLHPGRSEVNGLRGKFDFRVVSLTPT